jgi:regulator of protease activity HflC (stomatin/prohibitin superfamily)
MIELIFAHPFLVGFGFFALLWILFGIYTLQPQESALLSRFGKPTGAKNDPGLHWRLLGWTQVRKVTHAIQEFAFKEVVFTKQEVTVTQVSETADAATAAAHAAGKQKAMAAVTVEGVVQYSVLTGMDNMVKALFRLEDPEAMIKQRFQNALRGTMNAMTMWSALEDKDRAAGSVQTDLTHVTEEFGHTINNISITNVTPDPTIVASNNALIASVAEMQTKANQGEGEKQQMVRIAQGKAETMIENGRGIAGERDKIVEGWEGAINKLKAAWPEAKPMDLMVMILFQNFVDAQEKMAATAGAKVIFTNSGPAGARDLLDGLRNTLIGASEATASAEVKDGAAV